MNKEVFRVENYREDIMNFYKHIYSERKKDEIREEIENLKNSFLEQFIYNTEIFVPYLIQKLKEEHHIYNDSIFINIPILKDRLVLNDTSFDILLQFQDFPVDFWVSKRLLKKYLKEYSFTIFDNEEIDFYSSKNDFVYIPLLSFSCPISQCEFLANEYNIDTIKPLTLSLKKSEDASFSIEN